MVKQLKFSSGVFAPREGEALLSYKMPFSARRLTVGDFDGNGNPEIVLASGDHIGVYKPDINLKLLWEFDPAGTGEITLDRYHRSKEERPGCDPYLLPCPTASPLLQ